MKRLIFIPLLLLLIMAGCESDSMEESGGSDDNLTTPSFAQSNTKNSNVPLNGLNYNMDSVMRQVIIKFNFLSINQVCDEVLANMIRKNKKLEYSTELGEFYGFVFTKDTWDSLHYYGYDESDISSTSPNKEIYLVGRAPYKERGIYEDMVVNNANKDVKHPKLFERGVEEYFKKQQPKVYDLSIADQASSYIEYNAKISFTSGNDEYITFSVNAENQKIVIKVDKSDIK